MFDTYKNINWNSNKIEIFPTKGETMVNNQFDSTSDIATKATATC
jgi:hypothetical protein